MNRHLSLIIALCLYLGLSLAVLDITTEVFGRPSRGVSYGISMRILALATSITGTAALLLSTWTRSRLPLGAGTLLLWFLVIMAMPQPGLMVRGLVAVLLSLALIVACLAQVRLSRTG